MGLTPGVETDLGWALSVITRAYLGAVRDAVSDVPGGVRGYLVLAAADQGEPSSQLALAHHLGVDRTAMTYLLDGLEGAGFVERRPDPADRRARRVTLTACGRARLTQLRAGLRRAEDGLLVQMRTDERTVLRDLLQGLARDLAPANPCDTGPCEVVSELVGAAPAPRVRARRRFGVRAPAG